MIVFVNKAKFLSVQKMYLILINYSSDLYENNHQLFIKKSVRLIFNLRLKFEYP